MSAIFRIFFWLAFHPFTISYHSWLADVVISSWCTSTVYCTVCWVTPGIKLSKVSCVSAELLAEVLVRLGAARRTIHRGTRLFNLFRRSIFVTADLHCYSTLYFADCWVGRWCGCSRYSNLSKVCHTGFDLCRSCIAALWARLTEKQMGVNHPHLRSNFNLWLMVHQPPRIFEENMHMHPLVVQICHHGIASLKEPDPLRTEKIWNIAQDQSEAIQTSA